MNPAAAYLRVSTDMQDPNSIDAQRTKVEELAKANGDHIVCWIIEEETAKTSDRKKLMRLFRDVKTRKLLIKRLYVMKFSRFMRNHDESILMKMMYSALGVEVVSVLERIPDEGPIGKFMGKILALMDEFSSDITGMHVLSGMEEIARRGYWPGGPAPFGLRLIEIPNREEHARKGEIILRGDLVPDEKEAPIVRRIFELAAKTGWGGHRICNELSREFGGLVIGRKGRPLSGRGVNDILRNTIYKGLFTYNRYSHKLVYTEEGKSDKRMRKQRITKPEKDWVKSQNESWRIVSDEVWEAAQRNRLENIRKDFGFGPKPPAYALTGLVVCGVCGNSCGGHWQHSKNSHYYYYRCREAMNGAKTCSNQAKILGKELEAALVSAIETKLFSEAFFEQVVEEIAALRREAQADQPDRPALERKRCDLTLEIVRLSELAAKLPDIREVAEKLANLQKERGALEARLTSLETPAAALDLSAIKNRLSQAKVKTLNLVKNPGDLCDLRRELGRWIDQVKIDADGQVYVRWKDTAIFEIIGVASISDEGAGAFRRAFNGYFLISCPNLTCNFRVRRKNARAVEILGLSGFSGFSGAVPADRAVPDLQAVCASGFSGLSAQNSSGQQIQGFSGFSGAVA